MMQQYLIENSWGLERYIDMVENIDINSPAWRKKFSWYYNLRLTEKRMSDMLAVYESLGDKADFATLMHALGGCSAAFASKLLATINPDLPIIDSRVINLFDKKINSVPERAISFYNELVDWYDRYLESEECRCYLNWFDTATQRFADKISRHKKVDFLLWSVGGLKDTDIKQKLINKYLKGWV